jgi:16S rRNA (cytosine1402-N4)-methyltransferase
MVKTKFKERDGIWKSLTKKPIEASDEELEQNSRARSAKLRIAQRIQSEN